MIEYYALLYIICAIFISLPCVLAFLVFVVLASMFFAFFVQVGADLYQIVTIDDILCVGQ